MKTKIYGYSDDLIEIEGAITEEVDALNIPDEGLSFSCSDGTNGRIKYNGDWSIEINEEGLGFVKKVLSNDEIPHSDEDAFDCTSYSDVLVLKDIQWIKIGDTLLEVE